MVSKKIIKSAVKRNIIRRRVYEYIRPIIPKFDRIYDVVIIIGSSEILGLSHTDMTNQINTLLKEAGLIK